MALNSVAPLLSTPETRIFEEAVTPAADPRSRLSDEELYDIYEVRRTTQEIFAGRWQRIALQFPDEMLSDAPRVFEALQQGLSHSQDKSDRTGKAGSEEESLASLSLSDKAQEDQAGSQKKLFILADTSYGACCVDEIAAEHVDADVVVHYGRACLSPTARLPVIYVFTLRPLSLSAAVAAFEEAYPDHGQKTIVMADVAYSHHVPAVCQALRHDGYANIHATTVVHDPSSPVPNRTIPAEVAASGDLRDYHLFHIAEPPGSLLLTLSSRLASVRIYATDEKAIGRATSALEVSTTATLRRRYALVTSLATASVFGILINTLSVRNYLEIVEHVKAQMAAAGKKAYTFVVGKVNAAKLANFSEVGGWVVISCWESSLIDSKDFWRPVITPFELRLALQSDSQRIWTGEWTGDFHHVLEQARTQEAGPHGHPDGGDDGSERAEDVAELDSEPESAPPEFDLSTGRYVSQTRPMQRSRCKAAKSTTSDGHSGALMLPAQRELTSIRGQVSPGADYLRTQRTWTGLGSDVPIAYEVEGGEVAGARMEQGRSGIARGYRVGDDDGRH